MTRDTEGEPAAVELRSHRSDGSLILYDPARLPEPRDELFDPAYWRGRDRVLGTAPGRGTVHIVQSDQGSWVLRHYQRGGVVRHLVHDRYFWNGRRLARPFRELRWLARLSRRGLPVPAPVAARVRRPGLWYRGDILMVRVPGTPLGDQLRADRADPATWFRVGQVVRGLHDAGVFHADLNVDNVLVQGDRISLIDFDRARGFPWSVWRRRNLARLERSALRVLGEEWDTDPGWEACRRRLWSGYDAGPDPG